MKESTDENIMQKVKSGNSVYISLLFDRYAKFLYNYFYKLSGDRQESEDLTQNVFLRIIMYSSSFNGNMSFKSWIFQIARNQYFDLIEKKGKEKDLQIDKVSESILTDEIDENQEKYSLLEQAMSLLEQEERELIILAKYQNYKYKDLANTYNTSEGAIKVKIHRCINELRGNYFKLLNQ